MITAFVVFQLAAASAAVPGQVDSICREGKCEIVAVQKGRVRLIDQWLDRDLDLGKYAADAQHLIPRTEAPVSDLRSARGWRVISTVYLDHESDNQHSLHVHFFNPVGKLEFTGDGLYFLLEAEIGNLFGGTDEIFAVASEEEHSYNTHTEIWFLPERGVPKILVEITGVFEKFLGPVAGKAPGVIIDRQTYDGINSDTKGFVKEFYAWDRAAKSLTLSKK